MSEEVFFAQSSDGTHTKCTNAHKTYKQMPTNKNTNSNEYKQATTWKNNPVPQIPYALVN